MRHASGHNYRNNSFIVDVAMGQIPRSTKRISSLCISCVLKTSNKHDDDDDDDDGTKTLAIRRQRLQVFRQIVSVAERRKSLAIDNSKQHAVFELKTLVVCKLGISCHISGK